jgi:hypothetical protein
VRTSRNPVTTGKVAAWDPEIGVFLDDGRQVFYRVQAWIGDSRPWACDSVRVRLG